jgi:hypothetical protein
MGGPPPAFSGESQRTATPKMSSPHLPCHLGGHLVQEVTGNAVPVERRCSPAAPCHVVHADPVDRHVDTVHNGMDLVHRFFCWKINTKPGLCSIF